MTAKVTLFFHGITPNALKVAILLEELGVEYNLVNKVSCSWEIYERDSDVTQEFGDGPNGVKAEDFLKINPYA